ncbi:MAG: two-component system response regulator, partial [Rhodoblastus sp.]|nr:two-component system response regulator [Rhodoblastus sp.]
MSNEGPVPESRHSPGDGLPDDRSLLIVDDDSAFLGRLARAMEARGY